MNTKSASGPRFAKPPKDQVKLVLYALASALLPYAAATLLILVGQAP